MRNGVFAKVGDSNTDFSPNLYGFTCGSPSGMPVGLKATLDRYSRVRLPNAGTVAGCLPSTSFSRDSAAAQGGVFITWSLNLVRDLPDVGYVQKPVGCLPEQTPLSCEVDAVRPRYALVTLGTNDLGMDILFGHVPGRETVMRLAGVVDYLLSRGVIPILSTIPPVVSIDPQGQRKLDAGVSRTNAGVWRLSRSRRLPMINLWRALTQPSMIGQGLSADGIHLSLYGNGGATVYLRPDPTTFTDSVNFTRPALRYGANRRNLIWLKTLSRLDKITG
jgi:hypothetical protein